ncbi:AMP-binding enzyme [Streptomyces sp. cf386]|uniref:AMP-binding protein n=1 Tax=Streptomyces sp. cf386 TaxID=1761904 RepID=UPI000888D232|nr:AMP-binding protein [Streptomyces sp. cf386]SDP64393.1 AMP-binding enzyme [Streptomyces sp. cf386]
MRARGTDWPVTALAVQRTGAAYLPLDPEHPAERLRRTLADATPVLVVADDVLPNTAGDVPVLVLDPEAYEGEPFDAPSPNPSTPAYVIHTSGSTGTPKGVVPHSGLAAHSCRPARVWRHAPVRCPERSRSAPRWSSAARRGPRNPG